MTQITGRSVFIELQPSEPDDIVVVPGFPPRATSWARLENGCTCATFPHIAQCGVTIREGGFRLQLSQGRVVEQKLNPNAPGHLILFRQDFETHGYHRDYATALVTPEGKVEQILRFHTLDEAQNSFFARCLPDRDSFLNTRLCDECGRDYTGWSHSEDCATGAADRILSGDASDLFDN